jgi:hypothetical protein
MHCHCRLRKYSTEYYKQLIPAPSGREEMLGNKSLLRVIYPLRLEQLPAILGHHQTALTREVIGSSMCLLRNYDALNTNTARPWMRTARDTKVANP